MCEYLLYHDLAPVIGSSYAAVILECHMQRLALVGGFSACVAAQPWIFGRLTFPLTSALATAIVVHVLAGPVRYRMLT